MSNTNYNTEAMTDDHESNPPAVIMVVAAVLTAYGGYVGPAIVIDGLIESQQPTAQANAIAFSVVVR